MNEGFGKNFYRKGSSVKRPGPFSIIGTKNQPKPKERNFWPDIPVDIRPKTSVRRPKSWKTSIVAQTSRADVHEKTSV